jgi:hypothetical protein
MGDTEEEGEIVDDGGDSGSAFTQNFHADIGL